MEERVKDILSEFTEMNKEKMTRSTKLVADLNLNSLDVVNIMLAFEDEFDIEVPDRILKNFNTIGDITNYLEKTVNK